MLTWAKHNPKEMAYILWGIAALLAVVWYMNLKHEVETRPGGPVITAPVGTWSQVIPIPEGICMSWARHKPDDHFLTDMRDKKTGKWFRQPTSGYPDADAVRFTSATNKPAEVVLVQRQAPC